MDLNFSSLPQLLRKIIQSAIGVLSNTPCSHLNGKHVVFGEVLEGYELVEKIENVPKQGDKPVPAVTIVKSGELPVPEEGIHVEL